MGRLQGAAQQCTDQAHLAAADPARRLHVRRRGAGQELPDGLLLQCRAAAAQDAAALPRVHARGAPRAGRVARHCQPAAGTRQAHGAALSADLLRRVSRRRRDRRDDPAPPAGRAVREPRQHRHHVQLQARRPLPERLAPRPHPAGDRVAEGEARSRQCRQRHRLPAGHARTGGPLPIATRTLRPKPR